MSSNITPIRPGGSPFSSAPIEGTLDIASELLLDMIEEIHEIGRDVERINGEVQP